MRRPPMVNTRETTLGRVSVVSMARAMEDQPSGCIRRTSAGRRSVMRRKSSGTPMTPVEASSTWLAGILSSAAARLAQSRAACIPWAPVAQLALPAFTTMAWAVWRLARRCRSDTSTGAALTRFAVNSAATRAGTSEYARPTSGPEPCVRSPPSPAANRNPRGTEIVFCLDFGINQITVTAFRSGEQG